jgi:acetyl-CoA carboxylase biotin carboxyl carrier protein
MTDATHEMDAIERAVSELLPELSRRLARHRLGEIEVRYGELRLRVAGAPTAAAAGAGAARVGDAAGAATDATEATPAEDTGDAPSLGVASPAVGFFVYGEGLGPGMPVDKGDGLGYVEMLGVRHDVRAPRRGTVRNLVAESGEAVEYGQVVLELEPTEGER